MPSTLEPALLWACVDMPHALLAEALDLPPIPGIYIVYNHGEVLYVGKAKNLARRWESHPRYSQCALVAPTVEIAWLPLPQSTAHFRADYEVRLIAAFCPRFNGTPCIQASPTAEKLVAEKLCALRMALGHSQSTVARALGIKQQAYSKYESGQTGLSPLRLVKVCAFFKVPVSEFLPLYDHEEAPLCPATS